MLREPERLCPLFWFGHFLFIYINSFVRGLGASREITEAFLRLRQRSTDKAHLESNLIEKRLEKARCLLYHP